jgi:hypothetical protein
VKIVRICICFVSHLICISLAKIKAAKSQIYINDRANINIRGALYCVSFHYLLEFAFPVGPGGATRTGVL